MSFRAGVLGALTSLCLACGSAPPAPRVAEGGGDVSGDRCGATVAYERGAYLTTSDGARLWFHVEGPEDAPAVLFLHGGPGYNAYAFERAVGDRLERDLRMIYFDQRGCGRSGPATRYGMQATLDDVDALLQHLAIERVTLLGHSFGALVAIEYLRHRPRHVERMILVDMSADVPRVLEQQVSHVAASTAGPFSEHAGAIEAVVAGDDDPLTKLMRLYGVVGREGLQRELHWASTDAQTRGDGWDAESALIACTQPDAVRALLAEGYMTEAKASLMASLGRPGLLIAGRHSRVVGEDNAEAAARGWGLPLRWFERSGHFVYVEEPESFAAAVIEAAAR